MASLSSYAGGFYLHCTRCRVTLQTQCRWSFWKYWRDFGLFELRMDFLTMDLMDGVLQNRLQSLDIMGSVWMDALGVLRPLQNWSVCLRLVEHLCLDLLRHMDFLLEHHAVCFNVLGPVYADDPYLWMFSHNWHVHDCTTDMFLSKHLKSCQQMSWKYKLMVDVCNSCNMNLTIVLRHRCQKKLAVLLAELFSLVYWPRVISCETQK